MVATDARDKVKSRADVQDSTFDTEIAEFVTDSVDRLFPILAQEYWTEYSYSGDDLSIALSDIDADLEEVAEIQFGDDYEVMDSSEWSVRGGVLTLRGGFTTDQTFQVLGTKRYDVTTLPAQFNLVVVYYALSEFYSFLAGNKRKFNIYQQSTGARSVSEMRDEAKEYEDKGDKILVDRTDIGGL